MKVQHNPVCSLVAVFAVLCGGALAAAGQSRWPAPRKEPIQVRLIAQELAYPRSSVFATDEVLIAEQELAKSESRFVKLVYDFLPYQSPLSASGLSYSLVHRVQATRDTTCDETLWEMKAAEQSDQAIKPHLKYASDSPIADLDRRQARLRCYRVTSEDYEKGVREPTHQIPY